MGVQGMEYVCFNDEGIGYGCVRYGVWSKELHEIRCMKYGCMDHGRSGYGVWD